MKLSQARVGLLILVAAAATSGCGYINSIRAKSELNETARAYKEKKFADAEVHARKAIELDGGNEVAPLFLARTIHAQYRRGDTSESNVAKANAAIEAYKAIEQKDPNNDEAFSAVTILLGNINKPDEQRAWVAQRANNEAVSAQRRSDAYAFLASKDWECSYNITESPANKQNVDKGGGNVVIQYKKPKEQQEYDNALKCTTSGLELAEKGISLNPDNEKAWGQKYNLLLEAKKLAQMDENTENATRYAKQADEAATRTKELRDQRIAREAPSPPAS
ncbi:MAG TPA: hypothetical protein VF723_10435 [Pyrinomonadaceae bacterium]|jgi:hypothetical protein